MGLSDGTLVPDANGNALLTDEAYFVPGNKIFQHFHFGFQDPAKDTNVVWGYCTFRFTGLPEPEAFQYNSTGYQIEDDFFCLGDYDYCKVEAKKYFKDKAYFKHLRLGAVSNGEKVGGLRIKAAHAAIEFGPEGDAKI